MRRAGPLARVVESRASLTSPAAPWFDVDTMQALQVGHRVRLRGSPEEREGRVLSRFDDDEGSWILVEWVDATRQAYLEQDLERVAS